MKKWILAGLAASTLTGCVGYVGDPAPYYGGGAPYYGTSYAPAYVGVYDNSYYRSYPYHRIHSGYSNGYWHYQHARAAGGGRVAAPAAHVDGGSHNGGGHDGGNFRH